MIIVRTITEFQKLLGIAKAKNSTYQILGSEREATGGTAAGMAPKIREFNYTYVLCCQLFTVYISGRVKIADAQKIKDVSSSFDFLQFAKISLKQSGEIECSDS